MKVIGNPECTATIGHKYHKNTIRHFFSLTGTQNNTPPPNSSIL